MRYERTVVGSTFYGNFEFSIVADNKSVSRFRNGYSNWNGKIVDNGFEVVFTDANGDEKTTWEITRKGAIESAIIHYCYSKWDDERRTKLTKGKRVKYIPVIENLEYKLVK